MNLLYRAAPEKHKSILLTLGMVSLAKGAEYERQNPHMTKRFLMDPKLTKPMQDSEELIHASPSMMYTDFTVDYNEDERPLRSFFGAVITDYLIPEKLDRHCRVKFAIGGYYDRRGQLSIERLMIPETFHNPDSDRKWLVKTDIHEGSIQGALYYARLCAAQLLERKEFTPEDNFKKSLSEPPEDALVRIQSGYKPQFSIK